MYNEQHWRAQQLERQIEDPPYVYVARSLVSLLWYDPVTDQSLGIAIQGEFPAQAEIHYEVVGWVACIRYRNSRAGV